MRRRRRRRRRRRTEEINETHDEVWFRRRRRFLRACFHRARAHRHCDVLQSTRPQRRPSRPKWLCGWLSHACSVGRRQSGSLVREGDTLSHATKTRATTGRVMEDDQELNEALVDAARYGEMDEVRDFLTRGARADAGDGLLYAAANGHEEIVQVLLEFGADVNKANVQGSTALHWACLNGHVSIVQLLIDKGGNASACNQAGRTPLDEAMHNNREECVKVIMESDAGGEDEEFEFEEVDGDDAGDVDSDEEEE